MLPEEGGSISLCCLRFPATPAAALGFSCFRQTKIYIRLCIKSQVKFVWSSEIRLFLGGGRSRELKNTWKVKVTEFSRPIQTAAHILSLTCTTRRAGVDMPQVSTLAMLCVFKEKVPVWWTPQEFTQIYDKGCGNKITHLLQIWSAQLTSFSLNYAESDNHDGLSIHCMDESHSDLGVCSCVHVCVFP